MSKKSSYGIILAVLLIVLLVAVYFGFVSQNNVIGRAISDSFLANVISTTSRPANPFLSEMTLEEAGSLEESPNVNWWVNSGGRMLKTDLGAETIQGSLKLDDKWRIAYAQANSMDTDGGFHPQNIFRLVNKGNFRNLEQQSYFFIHNYNLSTSTNRNESNGILLFNHYEDSANLYYTGVRVDGYAVIKKKIKGVYFTVLDKKIFDNGLPYNKVSNPNLIPVGQWIGVKSVLTDLADGSVRIQLYIDKAGKGNWELTLDTVDTGTKYGGPAILDGHVGIRTDFMDVSFKDYKIKGV